MPSQDYALERHYTILPQPLQMDKPTALKSTIRARQTCFCRELPLETSSSSCLLSDDETANNTYVRMHADSHIHTISEMHFVRLDWYY